MSNRNYERKLFLLGKENADLRSLTLEMREQISQLDITNKSINTKLEKKDDERREIVDQLTAIHKSRGWKILQRMQKLRMLIVPPGSSREKVYLWISGTKEK